MESLAPLGSSATTRRSSPDFQPGVPRILLVEDAEELVAIWRDRRSGRIAALLPPPDQPGRAG